MSLLLCLCCFPKYYCLGRMQTQQQAHAAGSSTFSCLHDRRSCRLHAWHATTTHLGCPGRMSHCCVSDVYHVCIPAALHTTHTLRRHPGRHHRHRVCRARHQRGHLPAGPARALRGCGPTACQAHTEPPSHDHELPVLCGQQRGQHVAGAGVCTAGVVVSLGTSWICLPLCRLLLHPNFGIVELVACSTLSWVYCLPPTRTCQSAAPARPVG